MCLILQYAELFISMWYQKLHVPPQKVPITTAASLLGVMSSLNWVKRNVAH